MQKQAAFKGQLDVARRNAANAQPINALIEIAAVRSLSGRDSGYLAHSVGYGMEPA
jgi:predicted RNA binding protein with dsRBD fold (UPF0201 family)